jgi:transcription elongation GreA/GreB family factor
LWRFRLEPSSGNLLWTNGAFASPFPATVNKAKVIQAIIARLREDLALYHSAALAARAEATHEQSKAENKYDTRGLEASYLARGQSKQAAEIENAIVQFEKLGAREFGTSAPIDIGAIVDLRRGREKNFYFIGPRAGGTEIIFEGNEILVITPESPLGAQLAGKKQGDKCRLEIAGQKQDYTISAVW